FLHFDRRVGDERDVAVLDAGAPGGGDRGGGVVDRVGHEYVSGLHGSSWPRLGDGHDGGIAVRLVVRGARARDAWPVAQLRAPVRLGPPALWERPWPR